MKKSWEDFLENYFPVKYRMKRRWGFWWCVQEFDHALNWGDPEGWYTLKSYRTRDEAVAHLVKLKLEGKEHVEL